MLWGVACYFNPAGFDRPLANFKVFSERIRAQGLPLAVVELAIGDAPFSIEDAWCDSIVRRRTDHVLWHKEALLNIGIDGLPDDCDKVCWVDGDVLFDDPGWIEGTERALERNAVVQPFSHCVWLPPGVESVSETMTHYPSMFSEYSRIHSFGFGWRNFGVHALEARILYGHVGFAWAARRDIIGEIGLYDADVFAGSNDNLMAHAFVGPETMHRNDGPNYSTALLSHFDRWADRALGLVDGDVGYVPGTIHHLWHGSVANRKYLERLLLLRDIGFDPELHTEKGADGLYRLTEAPQELLEAANTYFGERREDTAPPDLGLCVFGDGFYESEGDFRWARSVARLTVMQDRNAFEFDVSNNALDRFEGRQTIVIRKNDEVVRQVRLEDTNKVRVAIGRVLAGDELSFESDFEFTPSAMGACDSRRLAFMFW